VAGPSYFDTGQSSHFITYLFLIYLPMFIIFIYHSAILSHGNNPLGDSLASSRAQGAHFSKMQEGENKIEEQAPPGNNERQVEGSPFLP
jgi:hypothetical protein